MLAADEAANLSVPEDTYVADFPRITVDDAVSSVFAVRYVPPYSMKMRATGRENSILWGRVTRLRRELLMLSARVLRPEAFSIIPLKEKEDEEVRHWFYFIMLTEDGRGGGERRTCR